MCIRDSPTVHLRHLSDVRQGQHFAQVQTTNIAQNVMRHPWVANATVQLEFPSTVHVSVTEYKPVMLLALDDLWYVARDGHPFHRADSNDLDYPILTGLDDALINNHPDLASAPLAAHCDCSLRAQPPHSTEPTTSARSGFTDASDTPSSCAPAPS